jgi:LacI family transcriptional regulator, galactose operon repressor
LKKIKARLADVAREAGVSLATVDRTINGRSGVREHTAERIWDAVRRLESGLPSALSGNGRQSPLQFDFILPAGTNTFMQNLDDTIGAIGGELSGQDIIVRCHRIEGFNPYALANSIGELGKSSDGLAIAALDNPVVREAVNDISDHGVPVVTLVCDLSNARQIAYVGLDNRAAGRTAGYLMGRFAAGRIGQVALVAGSVGLSYRDHQEREMGFRDAIHEQFDNLETVDRFEDKDDYQQAHEQTNIILDRFPDLVGIYNIGGGSRGIGMALKERGRSDVVFIGHELTRFTRQFLIDGIMDAAINQDVSHEATAAFQHLLGFHGRSMQSPRLGQPRIEIFLRENMP